MKNKTPALEAEVLCKTLASNLHGNRTLPITHLQFLSAVSALSSQAAAVIAGLISGGEA